MFLRPSNGSRSLEDTAARVGARVPVLYLQSVRGGSVRVPAEGAQATLLAFLSLRPVDQTYRNADPSRAQLVFLKSLSEQYVEQGVRVQLVDVTGLQGHPSTLDERVNFTYDWQLDQLPLLEGQGQEVALHYGIAQAPTTLLMDRQGTVVRRWTGFTPVSILALALDGMVGRPSSNLTPRSPLPTTPGSPYAQRK